jgi:quercetin dioxygenase-like cupin family protein
MHAYETLAELALELLADEDAAHPSTELRGRLLEDVAGRARYAPFEGRVARFFGLDPHDANAALESITQRVAWQPGPMPGMWTAKVPGRPKVPGQTAVFLRSDPGTHCPDHRHLGEERFLLLEGRLVERAGGAFEAGDLVVKPPGSSHAFDVPEGEPCIAAYLLDGGLELVG